MLEFEQKKRGVNKALLAGAILGIAAIAAVLAMLALRPSSEEQTARILSEAHREGSAEFDALQKDIIISTDEGTVQSPTGMGTISMFINGKIRNKGAKTVTALEVSVAVVTQFNDVLRERKILVVPIQQKELGPGQTIPITLTLDGFKKDDDRANIRWKVTAIKAA